MRPRSCIAYCSICGAAISQGWPINEDKRWQQTAVLLHKEDGPFPERRILELDARNIAGDMYELNDAAKSIFASSYIGPYPGLRRPLYIPCHIQCLNIAKRAIFSKRPDPLHYLWLVLLSRNETPRPYIAQSHERRLDPYRGCFINPNGHSARQWIDQNVEEKEMHEADALDIPDMTPSICKYLEEISVSDLAKAEQTDGLPHLPQEITDLVWQHLCPLSNPPVACTRLVPPGQWHYALRDLKVLPWLWDIDTNVLDTKERTISVDRRWDWELLIRRLANRDTYNVENNCDGDKHTTRLKVTRSIEGLPPGLRNRRRIWNLAIDMLDELDD